MKKSILLLLLICLCIPTLPSCAQKSDMTRNYYMMDTVITVTLYDVTEAEATPIFSHCSQLLSELDGLWARQKSTSDASLFNESSNGEVSLDARTTALLKKALYVTQITDGAFDITVAPLVGLWNLCGAEDRMPTQSELASACALCGKDKLYLENEMIKKASAEVQIDLGGIGKGAAIEYLIDYLESCHLQGGLVSFGSNVAVFGSKKDGTPFKIGIKNPKDTQSTIGYVYLKSGEILSVSGDYERYVTIEGKQYHHILDTTNGYPAQTGLSSVVVIAQDGAYADALSTALFVMGEERAMQFYQSQLCEFEAVLIGSDGNITVSNGLSNTNFS